MNNSVALDPSPEEWLLPERVERAQRELGASVSLLKDADVFHVVLKCWIQREFGDTPSDHTKSLAWASEQWKHRLDSLYLEKKDLLDQASCRLLRVKNQGLALELYHRILADEATFEDLSQQFGVGPERFHGGILKQQPLANFPGGLGQLLRKLMPGDLSKPIQMGDVFGLVLLDKFVPAVHGRDCLEVLVKHELQNWIEAMAIKLGTLVESPE